MKRKWLSLFECFVLFYLFCIPVRAEFVNNTDFLKKLSGVEAGLYFATLILVTDVEKVEVRIYVKGNKKRIEFKDAIIIKDNKGLRMYFPEKLLFVSETSLIDKEDRIYLLNLYKFFSFITELCEKKKFYFYRTSNNRIFGTLASENTNLIADYTFIPGKIEILTANTLQKKAIFVIERWEKFKCADSTFNLTDYREFNLIPPVRLLPEEMVR